jgi:hypothetical protein
MAARCKVCDEVLPPERQIALIDLKVPVEDWTCVAHGFKGQIIGFMSESGGKEGRKTGYVLNTIKADGETYRKLTSGRRCHAITKSQRVQAELLVKEPVIKPVVEEKKRRRRKAKADEVKRAD